MMMYRRMTCSSCTALLFASLPVVWHACRSGASLSVACHAQQELPAGRFIQLPQSQCVYLQVAAEFDLLAQLIAATSLGGSSLVSCVQRALLLAAWSSRTSPLAGVSAEHSTMLLCTGRPGALCCEEMCSNCKAGGTCASASWLSSLLPHC